MYATHTFLSFFADPYSLFTAQIRIRIQHFPKGLDPGLDFDPEF
jgi:hypothetical protein